MPGARRAGVLLAAVLDVVMVVAPSIVQSATQGNSLPAPSDPALPPLGEESCASHDGQWRLVAQGHILRILDASGQVRRSWPVADRSGRPGRVLALADHASRRSFIVALRDLNELWELSYDARAEPVYDGLVHDYRMGEGLAQPGFLALRRTPLAAPVLGLEVDGRVPWVRVQQADGMAILHLDVRRVIPHAPAPAPERPQAPGR